MRTLQTAELKLVVGGYIPPDPVKNGVTDQSDPAYWSGYFGAQVGAPASGGSSGGFGGGGVTLTPAESSGLSDVEAAKLIGWIEVLGAFTDPATALESDAGVTGFSAVELEKTTMAMKMYCTDHDEGWAPGPQGSPGVCTH
jgi:hypothetical protein